MGAFEWWLLGDFAERAALRVAKSAATATLGWILGPRFRSLRDDLNELNRQPGRGDVGARLIERAPDFRRAYAYLTVADMPSMQWNKNASMPRCPNGCGQKDQHRRQSPISQPRILIFKWTILSTRD